MIPTESLDVAGAHSAIASDPEIGALAESHGAETAGLLLDRRAVDGYSPGPYWKHLRREFRRLICDPTATEYASVREKATKAYHTGQVLGLPVLCAAIAVNVKLEVALITPFVALLVDGVAKVGTRAWCNSTDNQEPGEQGDTAGTAST